MLLHRWHTQPPLLTKGKKDSFPPILKQNFNFICLDHSTLATWLGQFQVITWSIDNHHKPCSRPLLVGNTKNDPKPKTPKITSNKCQKQKRKGTTKDSISLERITLLPVPTENDRKAQEGEYEQCKFSNLVLRTTWPLYEAKAAPLFCMEVLEAPFFFNKVAELSKSFFSKAVRPSRFSPEISYLKLVPFIRIFEVKHRL